MVRIIENTVSKTKTLIKGGIWYTIGGFLLKGIGFFTAPIFIRLLTTEEYGITSVYNTWLTLIGTVVMLQVSSSIATAMKDYEGKRFDEYLSSTLTLATISSIVFILIMFIFSKELVRLMKLDRMLIILMGINSFFVGNITFISRVCIREQNHKKYLTISFLNVILSTLISIALILIFKENKYLGRILGGAIATALLGLSSYISILKKTGFRIDIEAWKYCLKISLPMIFHVISTTILSQSDRIMINNMIGSSEAGIYSFIYNIGSILLIITTSFNNAWVPWYYNNLKENNKDKIKEVMLKYMFLVTIISITLMMISPEIVKIMAPKTYWAGIKLVPLLILSGYMTFLYTFAVNYEIYSKKTKLIACGSIITAIINLILNLLFIPKYGAAGATLEQLYHIYFYLFYINTM